MIAATLPWLLSSLLAPSGIQQGEANDAATPVAHFVLPGGEPATVTRGDIALEMAFQLRRKDDGRDACTQLIKSALVRSAAARASVWPAATDVRARWDELRRQLRAAGRDLEREPIFRNCSEQALLDYLAVDLAHELLVRHELGLREREQVSPAMLELWVKEARERTTVVDDPDQLPIGTAVRVGDHDVPLLDLGMLLLRSSDLDEQDQFVRQVVVLQSLEMLARQRGITVTDDELQRELSLRRALAHTDPRFRGLTFEQLLKSQGLTIEWLLQSRVFRANVVQKKLVALLHPRADLQAELDQDRVATLERFGARRRLGIIFARALDEPNQLVPRDFAAAIAHLETVRIRLAKDAFDTVAKIESDDPGTKARGGDCGWLVRRNDDLPEAVLAAAWSLDQDAITAPIRSQDGCYLVKVLDIEPMPSDDVVLERMREHLVVTMTADLLEKSALTRADGTSMTATPAAEPTGGGR